MYVGESSRSIFERRKEHWVDYRNNSARSHILKHHRIAHEGVGEPCFIMRTVSVPIRGKEEAGSILNLKNE